MKCFFAGKNSVDVLELLSAAGCVVTDSPAEADFVVAHGGDGSLLQACRQFRSLPVLALRDRLNSELCSRHSQEDIIKRFLKGDMKKRRLPFLEGTCGGRTIYGINDIFIHNCQRGNALRYAVTIDGRNYASGVIGDAVGVATVHGATAYYRSITRSIFRVGIGLAFSNSTELVNHLVLAEDSVVDVEIIRGPGVMIADNSPEEICVPQGGSVTLCQSSITAEVYGLEEFMCAKCRDLRHPRVVEE